jgi:hypothetical protein
MFSPIGVFRNVSAMGWAQSAILSVRLSGRLKVAQQFTAGIALPSDESLGYFHPSANADSGMSDSLCKAFLNRFCKLNRHFTLPTKARCIQTLITWQQDDRSA